MSWWVIEVGLDSGADPEAVAQLLVQETSRTALDQGGTVIGYAADERDARRAATRLSERFGTGLRIRCEPAEPVDWSTRWRDGLQVRKIGRLRVGPSWLLPHPDPTTLVIDPEMAFGSGEHGSTRAALALLDRHLEPDGTCLDLGSGSGILAIGAIKLGARRSLGIDVDESTVPIARRNAARNGVAGRAEFTAGDAAVLAPLAGPVGLVASNILRSVNLGLLDPIRRALSPSGLAVFAGMEVTERHLFLEPLGAAGFAPVDELLDEGWWAVAARIR